MTSIDSRVRSLSDLWFSPMPKGKPIKATRIATSNGTTVALGENGRIYSTQVKGAYHYSVTSRALDNTFAACVKLGVLTKAAVAEHRKFRDAARVKADRKYAAQAILRDAKQIGMPLTLAQTARLNQAIADGLGDDA